MANQEHLAILEQGIEVWNKWRAEDLELKPDLQKADLGGRIFKGANLQGANLTGAKLHWADLRGADLKGADLSMAKIYGVKFDNTMCCRNMNTYGCKGSQRFVRHAMDLDYVEETRENHPIKYWLWKLTSNCGRSIGQWALISVAIALLFGIVFAGYQPFPWLPEWLNHFLTSIAPSFKYSNPEVSSGWFTPYYFSFVTFTTLGFGDVTPINTAGQIWLTLEVILGYIMLGGLITLFASRMVRQSG